ncbi:MAG: hypothetical protein OHK0040_11840 [bacterium]
MAFKRTALITFFLIFILPFTAKGADFTEFIRELRNVFYSVQGKATLYGYTKDFGFAEIKEGSFKVGDLVLIKSSDLSINSEELAFGEVEDVKGKMARIYITSLIKPLKQDALVVGLKRIYANIKIDDNSPYLKALFLKEPEIKLQENRDEKTNVVITFSKNDEKSYGYKVTTPAGRLIMIGNLSLDTQRVFTVPQENIKIAFDEETGNHWIFKDGELSCHTCSTAKTKKINSEGEVKRLFSERKKVYLMTDRDKTVVFENGENLIYEGLITQGEERIFYPKEKKIYDLKKEKVLKELPQEIEELYYWKNDTGLAKSGERLVLLKEGKKASVDISDMRTFRIKNDRLYLYREVKEMVPLSGPYVALFLEVYDLKDLLLQKRVEISESFSDFDVDEKAGEFIIVKPDGTVKRVKF